MIINLENYVQFFMRNSKSFARIIFKVGSSNQYKMQLPSTLFSSKFEKKVASKKSSNIFRKWNFLALILRNFLYFLKRKLSYISGNGTFLYFRKRKFQTKLLYFRKRNSFIFLETDIPPPPPLPKFYISEKQNFLIFKEELPNPHKTKFLIIL